MRVNIYFNIAAVFLCIMMLLSYVIRKNLRGRKNELFLLLVIVISISGAADIMTNLYGSIIPTSRDNVFDQCVFNYIYFFVRNITAPLFIIYASNLLGIWHRFIQSKVLRYVIFIPYGIDVILLIINMFTPVAFGFDENGHYYRGQYIFILYIVAVLYMIIGTILFSRYHKAVDIKKYHVIMSVLPVTGLGVLVQVLNAEWRIEILSTTIMVLIATLSIQKAEEDVDITAGAQSYGAFLDDVTKAFITNRPLSLILIKISNHKNLRQTLGFESFSDVLKYVSLKLNKISAVITKWTDIYYIERGTFAVINDDIRYDSMLDIARLIHAYMEEPVKLKNQDVNVDVKTTVLRVPEDIDDLSIFLNFASNFTHSLPDENRVIVLDKYKDSKNFKVFNGIDQIISKAIERKLFFMYYQPIYSIKDDRFVSAEALIRLVDDQYGFVSPGIFIPAAEESGAIHKIGDFVINDVCRFMGESNLKELGVEYIEINLSVAQCIEPNLANKILSSMSKCGISSDMINLEITETAVDYDQEVMKNNIIELNNSGISFSLDDYGTGYSNLSRVAKLPIDIVKLDKSLVDKMDDCKMWSVITYTVAMLKKIGKKVLVEGVEEEWQYLKFKELGCDYIQGYYFAKPMSENKYIEFISNYLKSREQL